LDLKNRLLKLPETFSGLILKKFQTNKKKV